MTTIRDCDACAGEGSICGLKCRACDGLGRVELPGAGRHDHELVDAEDGTSPCVVEGCTFVRPPRYKRPTSRKATP